MRPNLGPPKRAVWKSRQEGDRLRNVSLSAQENLEGRVSTRNDGFGSGVVAHALTPCEPSLCRAGLVCVGDRAGTRSNEISHTSSPVLNESVASLPWPSPFSEKATQPVA